ncbi:MAG: LysM peptidoglycan-binding domain-containing protein [Caldilineaceae bacterium]|nr:LysM peptidoglycan-binding domain-containing protein [Caldilineaceae bacterium]
MAIAKRYHHFRPLRLCVFLLVCWAAFWVPQPVSAYAGIHVVQPGEGLLQIARRYGVSMSSLVATNGIANSNYIYTGQRLVIPDGSGGNTNAVVSQGGSYVTVGRGDSLSLIASLQGMTVAELMSLNGLTNPNHVWIGQQLRVRSGGGSSVSSTYTAPSSSGTHIVQRGETLSQIAQRYGVSLQQLMGINGVSNPNHIYVGQRLQVTGSASQANLTYAPAAGTKRIDINLSAQTLTAWQGSTIVLNTIISSGKASTPTVTGRYRIGLKYVKQRMIGPGYDIPDVPWVMYFWSDYAVHGAYWHNSFGVPISHGCVNMRPSEAEFLFGWAEVGTEVNVYY